MSLQAMELHVSTFPAVPESSPSYSDFSARKRVGRACDACRIKKSKCDGRKPCSRCMADDKICMFTDRTRRAADKMYPGSYVELLESRIRLLQQGMELLLQRINRGDDVNSLFDEHGKISINTVLDGLSVRGLSFNDLDFDDGEGDECDVVEYDHSPSDSGDKGDQSPAQKRKRGVDEATPSNKPLSSESLTKVRLSTRMVDSEAEILNLADTTSTTADDTDFTPQAELPSLTPSPAESGAQLFSATITSAAVVASNLDFTTMPKDDGSFDFGILDDSSSERDYLLSSSPWNDLIKFSLADTAISQTSSPTVCPSFVSSPSTQSMDLSPTDPDPVSLPASLYAVFDFTRL
ncbi:uncharacterized protein V1518DRAFT_414590 [Limtongia smithiae]|uniref:uncharacterized protein n=1 Tax=Limtongia smithiae TaxID=1125753 RepID=UPI0034CFFEAC